MESLYPRHKPKIRLPKEEIIAYVEEIYQNWSTDNILGDYNGTKIGASSSSNVAVN